MFGPGTGVGVSVGVDVGVSVGVDVSVAVEVGVSVGASSSPPAPQFTMSSSTLGVIPVLVLNSLNFAPLVRATGWPFSHSLTRELVSVEHVIASSTRLPVWLLLGSGGSNPERQP